MQELVCLFVCLPSGMGSEAGGPGLGTGTGY